MSVVEDVRKVIQDLVAPDLKAIDARLTSLERQIDHRFEGVDGKFEGVDAKLKALEQVSMYRHETLLAAFKSLETTVAANHAAVLHALDIDRRLERLDNKAMADPQAQAS